MNLFDGVISITGMTYLVFMGFEIIFLGYLLGRIRINGVGLGTAGVFVVAILFGVLISSTASSSQWYRCWQATCSRSTCLS